MPKRGFTRYAFFILFASVADIVDISSPSQLHPALCHNRYWIGIRYNMQVSYWLIIFGVGLVLTGLLMVLGVPFGKLPGDIHIEGEKSNFYFPVVTSIVVSIVLTVLLNLIFWFRK